MLSLSICSQLSRSGVGTPLNNPPESVGSSLGLLARLGDSCSPTPSLLRLQLSSFLMSGWSHFFLSGLVKVIQETGCKPVMGGAALQNAYSLPRSKEEASPESFSRSSLPRWLLLPGCVGVIRIGSESRHLYNYQVFRGTCLLFSLKMNLVGQELMDRDRNSERGHTYAIIFWAPVSVTAFPASMLQ